MNSYAVPEPIIHVIDDDARLLKAVNRLLSSYGYQVITYSSAKDFFARWSLSVPSCLVLDLEMPEMSGIELQEILTQRSENLPVIFVSGHGDIPTAVRALKEGALDFLTKPFDQEQLLATVKSALSKSLLINTEQEQLNRDREALARLSQRERQVCLKIAEGKLNKQIGDEFGTTEKTIKVQRGQVMRKLGAGSVADLVKLVERLRKVGQLPEVTTFPRHSKKTPSKAQGAAQ